MQLVGDVHGCFDELQDLLLNGAGVAWRPERDAVILLGDLVNKGPRSADVVRWARRHAGRGVFAVRGNHDDAAVARRATMMMRLRKQQQKSLKGQSKKKARGS